MSDEQSAIAALREAIERHWTIVPGCNCIPCAEIRAALARVEAEIQDWMDIAAAGREQAMEAEARLEAAERDRDARPTLEDLRGLVDAVYRYATESEAVPGTAEADRLIREWHAAKARAAEGDA